MQRTTLGSILTQITQKINHGNNKYEIYHPRNRTRGLCGQRDRVRGLERRTKESQNTYFALDLIKRLQLDNSYFGAKIYVKPFTLCSALLLVQENYY